MKKLIREVILLSIIALYFIYFINYNMYIKEQVLYSFKIWLNGVIPALFPTFIIIDFICNTNIPYYIEKYFHINLYYILSIIGGSPANILMIKNYASDKTKVLTVSKYVSLMFLYTNLKNIFSSYIAIIVIICNIVANLILMIFIKPKIRINKDNNKSLLNVISNIREHMITLLAILGIIIFFNTLPVFLIKNKYIYSLILSLMEITIFFNYIYIANLSLKFKLLLCVIAISTCGLCIECQIKSIMIDTSFNYKYYFWCRLWHLLIFMFLVFSILFIV